MLVMSEVSRLGREQIETAYALKQLSVAGVRCFGYLEDREVLLESATDEFLLGAVTFAADLERKKAQQRTYDAMARKAKAGHVMRRKIFGYDNLDVRDASGQRSHVERQINQTEAGVIRRIFELSVAGRGVKAITKILNAEAAPRLFRHPGFKHLTPLQAAGMYLLFGPQSNRLGLSSSASTRPPMTWTRPRKCYGKLWLTLPQRLAGISMPTRACSTSRLGGSGIPPENANVMRGALKDLAEIPPCSLVDAFAANVTDIPDEPVKGGANILQTFVEGLRQRLPERSGNQKQYPGTNLASNPRTARIETLARKTLTFTDNGDMATVIDTMFTIARSEGLDDLSKTEALGGLNLALAEGRTH